MVAELRGAGPEAYRLLSSSPLKGVRNLRTTRLLRNTEDIAIIARDEAVVKRNLVPLRAGEDMYSALKRLGWSDEEIARYMLMELASELSVDEPLAISRPTSLILRSPEIVSIYKSILMSLNARLGPSALGMDPLQMMAEAQIMQLLYTYSVISRYFSPNYMSNSAYLNLMLYQMALAYMLSEYSRGLNVYPAPGDLELRYPMNAYPFSPALPGVDNLAPLPDPFVPHQREEVGEGSAEVKDRAERTEEGGSVKERVMRKALQVPRYKRGIEKLKELRKTKDVSDVEKVNKLKKLRDSAKNVVSVLGKVRSLFGKVYDFFTTGIFNIAKFLRALSSKYPHLKPILLPLSRGLAKLSNLIEKGVGVIYKVVDGVFGKVLEFAKKILKVLSVDDLIKNAKNIYKLVGDLAKGFLNAMKFVLSKVEQMGKYIIREAKKIFAMVRRGIKMLTSKLGGIIKAILGEKAVKALAEFGEKLTVVGVRKGGKFITRAAGRLLVGVGAIFDYMSFMDDMKTSMAAFKDGRYITGSVFAMASVLNLVSAGINVVAVFLGLVGAAPSGGLSFLASGALEAVGTVVSILAIALELIGSILQHVKPLREFDKKVSTALRDKVQEFLNKPFDSSSYSYDPFIVGMKPRRAHAAATA